MSELTLIRHGQARAFQTEPDHLTEIGFAQARRLGEVWIADGVEFDEVHSGSLRRHRQTEEAVAQVYAEHGKRWPQPIVHPDWNEYDAEGVMLRMRPVLAASDERFRGLVDEAERHRGTPEQNRHFQRMFEILMLAWLEASVVADDVEPFAAFRDRVARAVKGLLAASGSKRVAVFCSGGPIGLCVQRALNAPDRAFLDVNWRVKNCSLSHWVYSRDRFTLDSFNCVTHLPPDLITFR